MKRYIALALIACASMFIVAACGDDDDNDSGGGGAAAQGFEVPDIPMMETLGEAEGRLVRGQGQRARRRAAGADRRQGLVDFRPRAPQLAAGDGDEFVQPLHTDHAAAGQQGPGRL